MKTGRYPTLAEAEAAIRERDRRRGRLERVIALRLDGWSHGLVMLIWRRARSILPELPDAFREDRSLQHHGIIPPTSTPKSGRLRRDDPPKDSDAFRRRYQEV